MSKTYIFSIVLLVFTSVQIFAQNSNVEMAISFDESISESLVSDKYLPEASWVIKDLNQQSILLDGEGVALYDFIFDKPGDYQIDFTLEAHESHSDACNHSDLPNSILLTVNDKSIKYFTESAELSQELKGGIDAAGIVLSVPIEIKSYNNEEVEIPSSLRTSGIDAFIVGNVEETQQNLQSGTHTLNFILSGTVAKNTYISFDFEDLNGNDQTYYHLQEIK